MKETQQLPQITRSYYSSLNDDIAESLLAKKQTQLSATYKKVLITISLGNDNPTYDDVEYDSTAYPMYMKTLSYDSEANEIEGSSESTLEMPYPSVKQISFVQDELNIVPIVYQRIQGRLRVPRQHVNIHTLKEPI